MVGIKGRRRMTCFHEAGHCLARWYFGIRLDRVLVLSVEQYLSKAWPVDRRGRLVVNCEGFVDAHDIQSATTADMLKHLPAETAAQAAALVRGVNEIGLIVCFAGPIAEDCYTHQRGAFIAGGKGDCDQARQILQSWLPGLE